MDKALRDKQREVSSQYAKCQRLTSELRAETLKLGRLEDELAQIQSRTEDATVAQRITGWLRSPLRKEPLAIPPPEEEAE